MKRMAVDDELRTSKGWCLGIITDPRGPTHTFGAFSAEMKGLDKKQAKALFGMEEVADPMTYHGKAEVVVDTERARIIQDCLGLCYFATHRSVPLIGHEYNIGTYGKLIKAATGWDVSENELIEIAERILALEKSFNVLAGLRREDDYPPDRYFEPVQDGPFKGIALNKQKVSEMIRKHDELHGWDSETGIPLKDSLQRLGIEDIAKKLWS